MRLADYYRGKKILLTGHTGFKGSWLGAWLYELGAEVTGLSIDVPTDPSLYECVREHAFAQDLRGDIVDFEGFRSRLAETKPDIIFHLAAQSIVRTSYDEPLRTFEVNSLGVANILEAVRELRLDCDVVIVTSDKCYENVEWVHPYRETDRLGGRDIYSMSKGAAELVTRSWNDSFFVDDAELGHVVSVRAGNVIGGGDYARDRIVPDCARAFAEGNPVVLRNPGATRPWQHVLDCLHGYLHFTARLPEIDKADPDYRAFNFGPDPASNRPVVDLVEEFISVWPGKLEIAGDQAKAPHEAHQLNVSSDKAIRLLGWRPVWDFRDAVDATAAWYREFHTADAPDMLEFTLGQIRSFEEKAATVLS